MICRIDFLGRVVLVGHDPLVVFAASASQVAHLKQKSEGHYDRDELMALAEKGQVVLYSEEAVRDIVEALPLLLFGCPPTVVRRPTDPATA